MVATPTDQLVEVLQCDLTENGIALPADKQQRTGDTLITVKHIPVASQLQRCFQSGSIPQRRPPSHNLQNYESQHQTDEQPHDRR